MRTLNATPFVATPQAAAETAASTSLIETRIAVVFDDGRCLLANGSRAERALSCLVEPVAGDRVLVCAGEGGAYVLHILARPGNVDAHLSVPGADSVSLRQPRIAMMAAESLELASAADASLSAVSGTLSLTGQNLFSTFTDTIVEHASHCIGKFGQCLLEARQLFRLHGEHALITAERDVKVDGERISVG